MIDWVAYALKAAGVAFLLVAAIGVLRLPDAFTRMHAATKAGTLGAGLVVLGAALPLASASAVGTALATLFILLLTVPLASHALGRAAYISGAPFWHGTEADGLAGTLPRGTAAAETPPAPQPIAIERVLVAPTYESNCNATTHAVSIARALDVPLACVGIIDPAYMKRSAEDARLARTRVQIMLLRAAALGAGETPTEVIEDDPMLVLTRLARSGDLIVLPANGWYNHGVGQDPDDISGRTEELLPLARSFSQPVYLAGDPSPVGRISILDDGSPAILFALATLAGKKPFGAAKIVVSWARDGEPSAERRAELSKVCGDLDLSFCAARPRQGLLLDPGEVVVATTTGSGRADWYGLDWRDQVAPGWRGSLLLL